MDPLELAGTQSESIHQNDYDLIKQAVINEQSAPELLPFQEELVERVKAQLARQEDIVDSMFQEPQKELPCILLQWEMNRAQYLLRRYYRIRLAKVQRNAAYVLDRPEYTARMSLREQSFAKEYFLMSATFMSKTVLDHLPKPFQCYVSRSTVRQHTSANASTAKDLVEPFKLNRPVLFRALEQKEGYYADEEGEETVDLEVGDQLMMRYNLVQKLLDEGSIQLL